MHKRSRPFTTRYTEYTKVINPPNIKSNFTEHILDLGHNYTNVQSNLEMLLKIKKAKN